MWSMCAAERFGAEERGGVKSKHEKYSMKAWCTITNLSRILELFDGLVNSGPHGVECRKDLIVLVTAYLKTPSSTLAPIYYQEPRTQIFRYWRGFEGGGGCERIPRCGCVDSKPRLHLEGAGVCTMSAEQLRVSTA